jgi:hypothetical protein
MSEREFRSLLLKMISDLQEDSNKQINEVGESIQDIDKNVSNMERNSARKWKFRKITK